MKRIAVLSLLVLGLVTGCGGGDTVSGEQAKAAVEKAADVKLKSEAKTEKGMKASYTGSTADGFVAVGVFDDADGAKQAVDEAKKQSEVTKGTVKIYDNKNVVVVFGAINGKDNPKLKAAVADL